MTILIFLMQDMEAHGSKLREEFNMIRSVYNHHSSNDSSNKGCILYMLVGFSYCMIYIFHTLLPAYLKYSCILITILPMSSVNYLRGNYSIILHLLIFAFLRRTGIIHTP